MFKSKRNHQPKKDPVPGPSISPPENKIQSLPLKGQQKLATRLEPESSPAETNSKNREHPDSQKECRSLKDRMQCRAGLAANDVLFANGTKTATYAGDIAAKDVWWETERSFSCFQLADESLVTVHSGSDGVGEIGESCGTSAETSSSSISDPLFPLVQVDPVVDFFIVDEELLGRFRICSRQLKRCNKVYSKSHNGDPSGRNEGDTGLQQQQAIIFKIKTTSPYSFWVRPIYGLMRPNVIAWVEVKCELKAKSNNSFAKLVQKMDEFLVEVCPVPGAINAMTSDLYTSCVHSNLPELLNIWERVEQQLKENSHQRPPGFIRELHRVSCRFQRSSLSTSSEQSILDPSIATTLSTSTPGPHGKHEKPEESQGSLLNNNLSESLNLFEFPTPSPPGAGVCSHPHQKLDELSYHLAREFSYSLNEENLSGDTHRQHPYHGRRQRREGKDQCGDDSLEVDSLLSSKTPTHSYTRHVKTVRLLGCLSFVLGFLLLLSLCFILYSHRASIFPGWFGHSTKNGESDNSILKQTRNSNVLASKNK